MQATMNDYIYLDNLDGALDKELILGKLIPLCQRRSGIGSDGVIFLSPSKVADAKMEMYNADGSRAEMCGNGSRSCIKLLERLGKAQAAVIKLETDSGLIEGRIDGDLTRMKMFSAPSVESKEETIQSLDKQFLFHRANIGNPHVVIKHEDLKNLDVEKYGKPIENNLEYFPKRTNVEFYKEIAKDRLQMRVWERGSGETLACGTGAACVAATHRFLHGADISRIRVDVLGGALFFDWEGSDFFMTGEVKYVYRGEIEL